MERKKSSLKIRDFDLEIKAVSEDGLFSGYGSVFGNVDSYNEIVVKGAFAKSLEERTKTGRKVPVLWQHNSGHPIGVYTKMEEDDHGLYVEGRLLKDSVQQAKEAYALMEAEAISGLSIGYYVTKYEDNNDTGIRMLTELNLQEVSLVTFPANEEARVEAVKYAISHGELPSKKDFEKFLREAGFSKTQAAVIANRGLDHLLRSESEAPANDEEEALKAYLEQPLFKQGA